MLTYDNDHWADLIMTIVDRIGPTMFLTLTVTVLKKRYPHLSDDISWLIQQYLHTAERAS